MRPSSKKQLSDRVAALVERERDIEIAQEVDGRLHPAFESTAKKIAASDWERSWLYDYFESMGPSDLRGNYYRYLSLCASIYY